MEQQEENNGRHYKEATGSLWKPDRVGEALEGEVINSFEDEYGLHFRVRTKGGGIVTTPAHRVLQDRLETIMADSGGKAIGCYILIEYQGENRSRAGRTARIYKVLYDNSQVAQKAEQAQRAQATLSKPAPIGAERHNPAEGIDTGGLDDFPADNDDLEDFEG